MLKAVMCSVRADDPSAKYHVFDVKSMVDYTSWLLRAAARDYKIDREESSVVYLSSDTHPDVSFQIAFREDGKDLAETLRFFEGGE